jgi:signal transduction histidine kinase
MSATSPPSQGSDVPPSPPETTGLRVGHVFLDVRQRRMKWLNATARHLHREGVPFTAAELTRQPLQTLAGLPVTGADLPLSAAWKQRQPVEARFQMLRPGGEIWQLTWTATPLRDARGHLLGILGSVLCQPPQPDTRRMAELAHDLRTPLQSLRLLCALGERLTDVDPQVVKLLDNIRTAVDRAVPLALNLLECCRGQARPEAQNQGSWVALEPLLRGLADEQSVNAQAKGLTLTTDLAAAAGWEIRTDTVRLGRVLANLLVNAIRYTPSGQVRFTTAWRDEGPGQKLALSVVDTGPGISREEQESIFQPFERGRAGREEDTSRSGDSGGSGLGLAVVDRLVDELGLDIEVYSEYGRGSAFHLLVPATLLRPAMPQPT